MKTYILFLGLVLYGTNLTAQHSVHFEELQKHKATGKSWQDYQEENQPAAKGKSLSTCTLNKRVFGWHPYWSNGLEVNYDWNLISDFSYFSYEVDPATGNALTTHGWSTASSVTAALTNGKTVSLCVTLFSSHATFFGNSTAQQTLISNLISLVQTRGAHGVNIDFEGVPASQTANFTNFMVSLSNQMHAAIPGSQVSMALYAVDWNGVFDMPVLNQYVDLFIIMGYDYYWSGSTTAGPNDPLYHYGSTYNYTLSRSVTYYLDKGAPKNKLVLGLPWYGREYTTSSSSFYSPVLNPPNSVTRTYKTVKDNVSGNYSNGNYQWEPASFSGAYIFNTGSWKQCFIQNEYGYAKRFDFVNQRELAGIGIWALGYDDGYNELWNLLKDKFSNCGTRACVDTLYDMGGPLKNYYDNENWTYTITPSNASRVNLNFTAFSTEVNYDSLWIYDGPNSSAPLIGTWTGSNGPSSIISSGPDLTLRFKSDIGVSQTGWTAYQTCVIDTIKPVTSVVSPGGWITGNGNISFTQSDNTGGSGLEKSFYQIRDFDGSNWSANDLRGFLADDFDTLLPLWTTQTGSWTVGNGELIQSDESMNNTNIFAPLSQNLSNRYLFHWRGSINGTGTNRRAGLHFFCDQPALPNRGNGYFIWFRPDQSLIQFYKVVNDVFSVVHSETATLVPGQVYDFKLIFDRITGDMRVYVDDQFRGAWKDSSPWQTGTHVSFRSGNSEFRIRDFAVYRSRYPSVACTTGSSSADFRYQNPSPSLPAGMVISIVSDSAFNLSMPDTLLLDVDWTPPTASAQVNDGPGVDQDTLYAQPVEGNYVSASDTNSGVLFYEWTLGSNPGDSDVVSWTQTTALNWSQVLNQLQDGSTYYQSLRATNGAGLTGASALSDGFLYLILNPGMEEMGGRTVSIFPNPVKRGGEVKTIPDNWFRAVIISQDGKITSVKNKGEGTFHMKESAGTYILLLEYPEGNHRSVMVVLP